MQLVLQSCLLQGRADYFGTSVNLAARIMNAAASAGQIALCMETAQGLFRWALSTAYPSECVTQQRVGLTDIASVSAAHRAYSWQASQKLRPKQHS